MEAGPGPDRSLREARQRLGDALRVARQSEKISLRKFAQMLYRSHSNLSEWETGVRLPPREVVEAYERELDVIPGSLLAMWEEAQPQAEARPRRTLRRNTVERPARAVGSVGAGGAAPPSTEPAVDDPPVSTEQALLGDKVTHDEPMVAPPSADSPSHDEPGVDLAPMPDDPGPISKVDHPAPSGHGSSNTTGGDTKRRDRSWFPIRRLSRRLAIRSGVSILAVLLLVGGVVAVLQGPDMKPPTVPGQPEAIAVDRRTGVLYVSDQTEHRVYRLASGEVEPLAGTGTGGFDGDGRRATAASLNGPHGLAVDRDGSVFIADQLNGRVRKVTRDGVITTVAMTGPDGRPSVLGMPSDVAVDDDRNLYIAESTSGLVRKAAPNGRLSTVAGGGSKPLVDGIPAAEARLSGVTGLAVDAAGMVYFTTGDHRLVKIGGGGVLNVVAGAGESGFSGDGGPAKQARLASPSGVAVDRTGRVFIADQGNGRIRRVDVDGTITTVAGGGEHVLRPKQDRKATESRLKAPRSVTVDDRGNVLIDDAVGGGGIRKLLPDGRMTTVATTAALPDPTTSTSTTPTSTTTTTTVPSYGRIFHDPFSRTPSGWELYDTETLKSAYADGGYRVTVPRGVGRRIPVPLQGLLSPTGPVPNDSLTIESKVTFESPSFVAGLRCRTNSTSGGGYRAQLTGGGLWAVLRFEPGSDESGKVLAGGSSSRVEDFRTDGPNQLRLDCFGGTSGGPVKLAFFVNGQKLGGDVEDPEGQPPGQVHITAQMPTNASSQTGSGLFDDVTVIRAR